MSDPVERVECSPHKSEFANGAALAAAAAAGRVSAASRRLGTGRARAAAAGRAVAVLLALGGMGLVAWTSVPSQRQPAAPDPLSNPELGGTLLRVGLSPEALAAAGFTATDARALVGRARSVLVEDIAGLRAADDARATCRRRVDGLERLVRSGLGSNQDLQDLAAARTALASAQTALAAALESARTYALGDGASPAGAAVLDRIRANGRWRFPTKYLCRSATEAEWVRLRDALSIRRQAQSEGGEVPAPTRQLLAAWDADAAVSAAAANLSARQAEVKTAWDAAVAGTP